MQWKKILPYCGVFTILSFGNDLITNWFGTQRLIAETAPILEAFLPHIGIGLIGASLLVTVSSNYKRLCTYLLETTIIDLNSFVEAHEVKGNCERMIQIALNANESVAEIIDEYYVPEMEDRHEILSRKYRKWLINTDKEGKYTDDGHSGFRASKCIEYFRVYGYFVGRWYIWRDRKTSGKWR